MGKGVDGGDGFRWSFFVLYTNIKIGGNYDYTTRYSFRNRNR